MSVRVGLSHRVPAADPTQERIAAMVNVLKNLRHFVESEDGPTAVEYAVMLALILVACITIVSTLGTSISGTFSTVNSNLSGANGS
jgi:pilus assembly protein Flp/PilA